MTVDLVLPAMGSLHVPHTGLVSRFGLELDDRGNVMVRPIASGRNAAAIDAWLGDKGR